MSVWPKAIKRLRLSVFMKCVLIVATTTAVVAWVLAANTDRTMRSVGTGS